LREVNLGLERAAVSVLAGRNGAGKTLLSKILAGLLDPTEGNIELGETSPTVRRAQIGYVAQDARPQIIGETVLDDALFGPRNLGWPENEAQSSARSALAACGLEGRDEALTHRLSGGEVRRLSIAGVLACRPAVFILDEPFANLDRDGVRAILRIVLASTKDGSATLVVTHELEKVLGIARSLAILDQGRIVASGRPETVLKNDVEGYGLRDPLKRISGIRDLQWLD